MANFWAFHLAIGVCCLWTAIADAQPSSGQELLDFVTQAHRASRELIRTTSCRVEHEVTFKNPQTNATVRQSCSGKYWSSADAIRLEVSEQNSNNPIGDVREDFDFCWKDSVRKSVIRRPSAGGPIVAAGRDGYENRNHHRCDAWVRGLLVLNVPGFTHSIPFEQFVEKASSLKRAAWKTVDGSRMAVIELVIPHRDQGRQPWDVEVYFDPGVNYLIRKDVRRQGSFVNEQEVVQFKECGPGLFFPERISGRAADVKSSTVLSDIRVNQPLPADVFNFRYPHNIVLSDGIKGGSYRVDAAGNPLSALTPHSRSTPPPRGESVPTANSRTETQEEPRSLTIWIILLALVILASAWILAVIRRRQARTSNA